MRIAGAAVPAGWRRGAAGRTSAFPGLKKWLLPWMGTASFPAAAGLSRARPCPVTAGSSGARRRPVMCGLRALPPPGPERAARPSAHAWADGPRHPENDPAIGPPSGWSCRAADQRPGAVRAGGFPVRWCRRRTGGRRGRISPAASDQARPYRAGGAGGARGLRPVCWRGPARPRPVAPPLRTQGPARPSGWSSSPATRCGRSLRARPRTPTRGPSCRRYCRPTWAHDRQHHRLAERLWVPRG